jgi:diaminohydroxyphosphoribosylaminopyrimidine deaminase/5-amino-6-(5-phosphoribosylamino)uracil reductase
MSICLDLAATALGKTYPNPLVGAVIVYDGIIIGKGYHKKAGGPHAEVNAINSVKDTSLLSKATLYVNLEPCCHHGKTPPCSDLIIEHNIKEVVVGCLDPNPKVAGKGVTQLKKAGCTVRVGILENESKFLNRRFFTSFLKQRPYIILKWAQSSDGFISPKKREIQAPVWITGEKSRQLVHKWRSEEQAILVGINTVLADNPSLTTRLVKGNSPHRFVIDPHGKIPLDSAVIDTTISTTIVSNVKGPKSHLNDTVKWIKSQDELIIAVLENAQKNNLQSIIVEGGSNTLQRFIDANIWDEARIFTGPNALKSGTVAPTIKGTTINQLIIEQDQLHIIIATQQEV